MKKLRKTITILMLIIVFFIIYFLQANFFSWFTIAGTKPNLFIIFTIFISLFAGMKLGIPFGIISGLYLDLVIGKTLGPSSIMLGLISAIGGYFDKTFSKDSKITIMLMIVGGTCIYEIGFYILQIMQLQIYVEITQFLITLLIEVIYNTILTIILYPFIQKFGYKIEDIFKGQKILTRYF